VPHKPSRFKPKQEIEKTLAAALEIQSTQQPASRLQCLVIIPAKVSASPRAKLVKTSDHRCLESRQLAKVQADMLLPENAMPDWQARHHFHE
jgi:hypothetical protein